MQAKAATFEHRTVTFVMVAIVLVAAYLAFMPMTALAAPPREPSCIGAGHSVPARQGYTPSEVAQILGYDNPGEANHGLKNSEWAAIKDGRYTDCDFNDSED